MKSNIAGILAVCIIATLAMGCQSPRTVILSDGSKIIKADGFSTHVSTVEIDGKDYVLAVGLNRVAIYPARNNAWVPKEIIPDIDKADSCPGVVRGFSHDHPARY